MKQRLIKPTSIQELYAKVPKVDCQRCGECCGPVEAAPVEKQIITEYCQRNNIPLKGFFSSLAVKCLDVAAGHWQCPMFQNGGCVIYEVRPLICRLQGTVPDLPCPNSPNHKYPLTSDFGGRLVQKSWRANR